MENSVAELSVQSSNIDDDDDIQLEEVTQRKGMRNISPQNGNTNENRMESNNTLVKSVKEATLPLDIDEYEKSLISLGECYFNTKFDKYK